MEPRLTQAPPPSRNRLKRWLLKTLAFAALALLVLNPNLKRAYLQIRHTLQPTGLIQPKFADMPEINRQIDALLAADKGRRSEARLVAKFVVRNIKYVSDYENWFNVEYWPKAEEVWKAKQEDCDGRAILAASILRSRGFASARLVIGLDHMWIRVDENEKDPVKLPHYIALLNPNPNFSLEVTGRPRGGDVYKVVRALVRPTALRETGTHLVADIPSLRKAILVIALVLLCLHPCRQPTAVLALCATALAGVAFLGDWRPGNTQQFAPAIGAVLLVLALVGALAMDRLLRRRRSACP